MADSAKKYQKLPGRGMRRGAFLQVTATFSRLWLGEDHLLLVDSNGFAESYKRFFFRDIEAIVLTRTRRGLIWNWVWLTLALLCGIGCFFTSGAWRISLGVVMAFFLFFALLNFLFGPTCNCQLTTAAQTEQLASLHRVRRATKVLAQLRPLIAGAQGGAGVPVEPPLPPAP